MSSLPDRLEKGGFSRVIKKVKEDLIKYDLEAIHLVGHYELDPKNPNCPNLDMDKIRRKLL